jgi:ABC-type nickel/cobalt efflux system permease component RcnA
MPFWRMLTPLIVHIPGYTDPFEVGSRIIVMSLLKVLVFSRSLKDRRKQYGRKTKINESDKTITTTPPAGQREENHCQAAGHEQSHRQGLFAKTAIAHISSERHYETPRFFRPVFPFS